MSCKLLSSIQLKEVPGQSPEEIRMFRRATPLMKLSYFSIKKLIEDFPAVNNLIGEAGIVVGSKDGELKATLDFLRGLAVDNVASPIHFQNSLHNSTTGFLTLAFKLTGPSVTVSDGDNSLQSATETAQSLIAQGLCELCFAVNVSAEVTDLIDVFETMDRDHPEDKVDVSLFCSKELHKKLSKQQNKSDSIGGTAVELR